MSIRSSRFEDPRRRQCAAPARRLGLNRFRCLVWSLVAGLSAAWLLVLLGCGGVSGARDAARRTQSRNNLKMIGLAVHNYHDFRGSLPPGGFFDDQDQGLHGWQTALLPYMEQQHLYDQVDFEAPWNAQENAWIFETPIREYQNPSVSQLQDAEGFYLSHYAGNSHVLAKGRTLTFGDIKDGTSFTLLAGEAAGNYRPWGHPENWRDPTRGINGGPDTFGNPGGRDAQMLMMDCSVRTISNNIDPQVLKALSTPAGGEDLPLDF